MKLVENTGEFQERGKTEMKELLMRRHVFVAVLVALIAMVAFAGSTDPVSAAKGGKNADCAVIQDGTILDTKGNLVTVGYDQWGYNYQAHMFNGLYGNFSRPDTPITEDDTRLSMKWSDTWLSNKDCALNGILDRGGPGGTSSAADGAWLTNHQWGINDDGTKWSYFVKIVYPAGGVVDDDEDGYDDNTGGEIIWGAFVIIQQVSNDPALGEHGLLSKVQPAGFGAHR